MMKEGTTAPGGGTAPTNLYNWYAATAGTGTYAVSSGNVTASICPKGWSLPTGGPSGDFAKLDIAYGGTGENRTDQTQQEKLMNTANNGPGFNWTSNRNGASVGSSHTGYWSRTVGGRNIAYRLYFGTDNRVYPQGTGSKWYGFGVRCIAYDSMQSFSAAAHSSDVVGTTYMLSDARDGKAYGAKKLADGNIWMMDNLELDLPYGESSRTLTPADSDVAANWDLEDTNNWCNQDTDACVNQKLISRTGYTNGETAPTYYYNWYTATAGTGTSSVSGGEVNSSICPKGWKLPTTAQFSALDVAYGGTGENRVDAAQITNFVNNVGFGFTGDRNAATVYYTTSGARYWSRSANSATHAYRLGFYSGSGAFYPQVDDRKWGGFAVRCVLQ